MILEREFSVNLVKRAKLHGWLATRRAPEKMAPAVGMRDLRADGALIKRLADFLWRLFQLSDGQ